MFHDLRLLILLFLIFSSQVHAESNIKAFTPGSMSVIKAEYQDKPLLLALWSLDCPSCFEELSLLREIKQQHPQLGIVLVSTDIETSIHELASVLKKYQVDSLDTWVFRGMSYEQLRYEVDPGWYGELPRSYMFKAGKVIQAVSGMLKQEVINKWMDVN